MSQTHFTARELRDALSGFATGVTIVTARDQNSVPVGMTASSFNSVSMDPPLVLWSVTKSALSAPAFYCAKHFAIHVLSSGQTGLSNTFARQGEDKFGGLKFDTNAHGVPLLGGCLACFQCQTRAVHDGGDHWIIVGQVNALERQNGEGLVFASGSYATARPLLPETTEPQTAPDQRTPQDREPEDDALEGMLIYQLSHAYRRLSDEFYKSVHAAGFSIPEWRILASLHNCAVRTLPGLSKRTFIEETALPDMLTPLAERGLCAFNTKTAQGTPEGHKQVQRLFAIVAGLEKTALKGKASKEDQKEDRTEMQRLMASLKKINRSPSPA